jgi:hypothetical protein
MPFSLLTSYLSHPVGEEMIELTEKVALFSLRRFEGKKTEERLSFLQQLHRYSMNEYRINHCSALYFFSCGNASIELDISIEKDISIVPYLRYNKESIKEDMHKLIELDYLLYCILKEQKLQKN